MRTSGAYAIEQGTLALSNNYDLTYVAQDLTIVQRAIEVTAAGQTKIMARGPGADVPDHGGHAGGGRRVRREPDPRAGENVGAYAIEQGTLALSNNYDLTCIGADLTIVQRAIEVTAAGQTKTYGGRGTRR